MQIGLLFTLKAATKSWIQHQQPSPKIFKEPSLQLCLIQGVHHDDGTHTDAGENQPSEKCEYVIAENEIIDNAAIAEVNELPCSEHRHCHQPPNKSSLIFLS